MTDPTDRTQQGRDQAREDWPREEFAGDVDCAVVVRNRQVINEAQASGAGYTTKSLIRIGDTFNAGYLEACKGLQHADAKREDWRRSMLQAE